MRFVHVGEFDLDFPAIDHDSRDDLTSLAKLADQFKSALICAGGGHGSVSGGGGLFRIQAVQLISCFGKFLLNLKR
ncbi:MAG: hypothetical protein VR71_01980 [Roseovarius sp. BRH_c41]|nr:MAG: hypothetical protein VR71_01980 [Roseovarius sp. BRH_c41]